MVMTSKGRATGYSDYYKGQPASRDKPVSGGPARESGPGHSDMTPAQKRNSPVSSSNPSRSVPSNPRSGVARPGRNIDVGQGPNKTDAKKEAMRRRLKSLMGKRGKKTRKAF